jgi:putative (di)nucleoside polyphosphate hydrolase
MSEYMDNINMYRKCVGAMIINENNEVLLCERIDSPNSWQMPQGGVDDNEEDRIAIMREISEEVGIPPELLEIIACMPRPTQYKVPSSKLPQSWNNEFIGQEILFFLIKFSGNDSHINLNNSPHPEFKKFGWFNLEDVPSKAIDFKQKLYAQIVSEFEVFIRIFNDFHKIYNPNVTISDIFVND